MPTSSQHPAAGRFARIATPLTRYLPLITASLILTGCGNSGSLFPPSLSGPTSEPLPTSPGPATDNYAPSISGKPQPTATVNLPYSFRPEAYDPDGDVLTFLVSRLPPWATFNAATGEIAGMPPKGWTGTVRDIRISVSDGQMKSALPAFSITVTESPSAPTSGAESATLSWTVPTQNVDGTPLANLSGYRIYYGTASSDLNQGLEISNAAATSAEVPGLSTGTWYFAMTAFNGAGAESSRTGLVTKVL